MELVSFVKTRACELYPEESDDRESHYRTRGWIVPHHLEPMVRIARELQTRYGGDPTVIECAVWLHDTGLVYGRTSNAPQGHESRSVEFARIVLAQAGTDDHTAELILQCIRATEGDASVSSIEERIVRSADIMSQFETIHLFAKAFFYPKFDWFIEFLEKKVDQIDTKIMFDEERENYADIGSYYRRIIATYHASGSSPERSDKPL